MTQVDELIALLRRAAGCLVASLVMVLGASGLAQNILEESANDDTPEVVPQQESVTIEPYTGPPIFLPEPPEPPKAVQVEDKTITDYYDADTKKKPRVTRTVRRYSDDTIKNHGEYQEFHEGGQVFAKGRFDEGVQVGEWNYYHPDGTLAKTLTYVDGRPDGKFEVRRADGTLRATREYAAGKRNGKWIIYGEDGKQTMIESHYADGKPAGVWQVWYPNGQQRRQVPFADGKQHGTIVEWDKDGNKQAEITFEKGVRQGTSRMWTSDGREYEQQYDEGRLVSTKEVGK